jgi:hypothetical protein
MKNLTVNYRGVMLEVEGEYYQGEEREFDYPGSGHEFEIEHVYAGSNIDIYDILETSQIYNLENLCIDKINEQN